MTAVSPDDADLALNLVRCVAVERVLAAYGIPLFELGENRMADRGDFSSDLVAAVERADAEHGPAEWEALLGRVYSAAVAAIEAHSPHDFDPAGERTCPADEACDALFDEVWAARQAEVPFDAVVTPSLLASPPAADFLRWGTDGGGIPGDGTIGEFIHEALMWDVHDRIWPKDRPLSEPVDPSTTKPEETT